jgi:hypothetical protein
MSERNYQRNLGNAFSIKLRGGPECLWGKLIITQSALHEQAGDVNNAKLHYVHQEGAGRNFIV